MKLIFRGVALLLLVAIVMASAVSCSNQGGQTSGGSVGEGTDGSDDAGQGAGGEAGGSGNSGIVENTEFDADSVVMLITGSSNGARDASDKIKDALNENITSGSGKAFIGTVYHATGFDLEITVGYVPEREISLKAYELLDEIEKPSDILEYRYLIYSENGKLAFAYDESNFGEIPVSAHSITVVAEEFISDCIEGRSSVILSNGIVKSGTVNIMSYIEELDNEKIEEAWQTLRESTTEEIYQAFRTYYSIFKDSLVDWMANLYDPVYGGFYATASGKTAPNIYPNIEAALQILNYMNTSGMTRHVKYQDGFTTRMQQRFVYYCKAIQDPNGYFYLPQMTQKQINANIGRRARDLGWCTQILTYYGSHPVYDTPNGYSGDGITADEYWESLGISDPPPVIPKYGSPKDHLTSSLYGERDIYSAVVASPVIAVASADYLSSHAGFAAYLSGLNLDGSPYVVGNELGESTSQIRTASGRLGEYHSPDGTKETPWYEGMTIADMMISYLNDHITPVGLFGTGYQTDGNPNTKGVEFVNTNGMMKIMAVYNGLGYVYKEPLLGARGLLIGVMSDEVSSYNICEVYNIWCALERLMENVRKYASPDVRESVLDEINGAFEELAPAAIMKTFEKQSRYQKADGTFSHRVVGSETHHQGGLPVGLGLNEGNVDANGFGSTSVVRAMCAVLGLPMVPVYTESDWIRFHLIINDLEKQAFGQ